eukprot:7917269-Pyramimonas_sp.AAC.2
MAAKSTTMAASGRRQTEPPHGIGLGPMRAGVDVELVRGLLLTLREALLTLRAPPSLRALPRPRAAPHPQRP